MNQREIAAAIAGIVPAVGDYVARALSPLTTRVSALETREPIRGEKGDAGDRGEKGEQGEKGEKGDTGEKGEQGIAGETGLQGEPGKPGDAGSPGEKGEPGERGLDGAAGRDGADGRAGDPGVAGERGEKGDPGKDADPEDVARLIVAAELTPHDVAENVAKAISLLAESPPVVAKASSIVLNINAAAQPSRKTITTRHDKDGNLVADVVEGQG